MTPPKIFARAIVPNYVKKSEWDSREGFYAPWIIGSRDEKALENETLDKMYAEFNTENADFSDFVDYLESRGCIVFFVSTPGVWSPEAR